MELTRLKRKLATATRGHKLLKDKRDELMRQFLDLVRENKALREKVEAAVNAANKDLLLARSSMPDEITNAALMAPRQEIYLDIRMKNVMSVEVPEFEYRTKTPDIHDIYPYGFAFTSSDLDDKVLAGYFARHAAPCPGGKVLPASCGGD
jgi:V/A-type H+-transporting ATPase subunit D